MLSLGNIAWHETLNSAIKNYTWASEWKDPEGKK